MFEEIEEKLLARWKDVREKENQRHQDALDKLDLDWEETLHNYRTFVKGNPKLIKGFARIFL
jgi:hypothetical protein